MTTLLRRAGFSILFIYALEFRRMMRWLVHIVTGLSTVFLLACVALAVRSKWRFDGWGIAWRSVNERTAHVVSIRSAQGRVQFMVMDHHGPKYDKQQWDARFPRSVYGGQIRHQSHLARQLVFRRDRPHQRIGFDFVSSELGDPATDYTRARYVVLPYWLLIALFGALPMVRTVRWAARFPRERRRRRGLCPNCGYDLRAATDRCPECGEAVPPKTPAVGPPHA